MFDFLKNKAVNFVADDLDGCISFISNKELVPESETHIAQITNTIFHFSTEIGQEKVSVQQVADHFKNLKNKYLYERNLKNYRDPDFASAYILMCFFIFLSTSKYDNSRLGLSKILTMCEAASPVEIRSTIINFTQLLRKDLNI